jgi:hypothetical protein
LYLHDTSANTLQYDCVIFALRKFTGGVGDEDENQPQNDLSWKDYFHQPPETAHKVVCTRKVNGEAGHLAARFIDNQFFLFVGSKNVHIVISTYSDIEKYSDSRYQFARIIAETTLDMLANMDEHSCSLFLNFLHFTKLTAVFELLQPSNQHIENLTNLQNNELKFITWTHSYREVERNENSYCSISPDVGIDFARKLGLEAVAYEIILSSEVNNRKEDVRRGYGYEGEVLYFVDKNDHVFGLVKKKTAWYIVLRAIREKAVAAFAEWKKGGSFQQSSWSKKVKSRLKDIQTWIGFSDQFCHAWSKLGSQFINWIINLSQGKLEKNVENNKMKHILSEIGVRPRFPCLWKQFLTDQETNDNLTW